MRDSVSRRSVLVAAAAVGATVGGDLGFALATTSAPKTGDSQARRATYDPRTSADGQVKLNATLDGSPAFWVYTGIIYGVRPRQRPQPMLAVCGCQANWVHPRADGSYVMAAALLSYFLDVETREFLDEFDNPLTKRRNRVNPNFFPPSGHAIFPADGSALQVAGPLPPSASAPNGFTKADTQTSLGRVEWQVTADTVVLSTDQFFAVKTQPQCEAQTRTGDRSLFFNQRVRRMPARYTATTISPWLDWMAMEDAEGHLVWHTTGDKRFSSNEIPPDYRRRAGELLEQLTARPSYAGES